MRNPSHQRGVSEQPESVHFDLLRHFSGWEPRLLGIHKIEHSNSSLKILKTLSEALYLFTGLHTSHKGANGCLKIVEDYPGGQSLSRRGWCRRVRSGINRVRCEDGMNHRSFKFKLAGPRAHVSGRPRGSIRSQSWGHLVHQILLTHLCGQIKNKDSREENEQYEIQRYG